MRLIRMVLMCVLGAGMLALAACGGTGGMASNGTIAAPNTFADQTVLDEQVGIGATNAYIAASKLGQALAQAGLIDKAKFKAADQKGYEAVQAVHAAYQAGNSATYATAAANAYQAAADITALVK